MIIRFFKDLDLQWPFAGKEGITTLNVIGSAALFLQTDYERGTKDADIIEVAELITPAIREQLVKLAGKDSQFHIQHRMYLDIVRRVLPFLPQPALYHDWKGYVFKNFKLRVLDVADVVVSKLKPYRKHDRDDIAAMIDRGFLNHEKLVERFKNAIERWSFDARAEDFPQCVANLHDVEKNIFRIKESIIELPSWVGE